MKRRNVYELNYARFATLLGQAPERIQPGRTYRLCSEGFSDLVIEKLSRSPTQGATLISMAHYIEEDGNLWREPELLIRVYPPGEEKFQELAPTTDLKLGRAEVIWFQYDREAVFSPVYPQPGRYSPQAKSFFNIFLALWLQTLKKQRHRLVDGQTS